MAIPVLRPELLLLVVMALNLVGMLSGVLATVFVGMANLQIVWLGNGRPPRPGG